jgi:hypothetical protein
VPIKYLLQAAAHLVKEYYQRAKYLLGLHLQVA